MQHHATSTANKVKRRNHDIDSVKPHFISRLCGYIFPFFVMSLILGPFFFVVPFVIIPYLGLTTVAGVVNLTVACGLVTMIIANYMKSVLTSPGAPPDGWEPNVEHSPDYDVQTPEGAKRFCHKCNAFKPPRTHHCRVCKKCVLKMDHHCPWINNCVGLDNHKSFLLFLVYAVTGIFYALVLMFICFLEALSTTGIEDFVIIFGFTVTATILLPVGIAIAMLLCWQLWLVLNNTTSIEYEEEERRRRLCRKEGKVYKYMNKYNVGRIGNLRAVFGGGPPYEWLLPTRPKVDPVYFKRDFHSSVTMV